MNIGDLEFSGPWRFETLIGITQTRVTSTPDGYIVTFGAKDEDIAKDVKQWIEDELHMMVADHGEDDEDDPSPPSAQS